MKRTRFDDWPCGIARTADLVGDWWTPLVLRQAFFGVRRFDDFATSLGIPRASLTARLDRLVEEGVFERVPYAESPARYEYHLTPKGEAFLDVLLAMWRWGEDWLNPADNPIPVQLVDSESGEMVRPKVVDETTGRPIEPARLGLAPVIPGRRDQ
ncbi:MAG: helix-turn-helix transcriptional regulator [Acidimicrobiia bacterium]|nr:helix-turn-helix transcriptional regulator [Acidimicrobiia bacterium]